MAAAPLSRLADCEGLILAAGQGRRLQQGPKWRVRLGQRTLLEHSSRALAPQVQALRWNLPADAPPASLPHWPLAPAPTRVSDAQYGGEGPLAGLLAALQTAQQAWLLYLPVDAVRPPPNLAQCLRESLQAGDRASFVAGQFTCGLIHRSTLPSLLAYLQTGQRSVRGWLQAVSAVAVDWPANGSWIWSINTPDELADAEQRIAS